MNEIVLSNNLNQIELEIRWHKENAGQSVWEIGRRLNHVKENDLAHGEFIIWVENQGIQYREANRLMKVADELNPNMTTLSHLGSTALYLIATLPEEEREKEHETSKGEAKTPDEMTVRELEDLKKQLRDAKAEAKAYKSQHGLQRDNLEVAHEHIDKLKHELENQEPEVVEKIIEVEKNVMHPHVEDLRSDNEQLSEALKSEQSKNSNLSWELEELTKRNKFIEKNYNSLIEQRADVDEKSEKFDQLTEAIQNARGDLDFQQKLVADYKLILKIIKQGNELLLKVSGITYLEISDVVNENKIVSREFDSLIYGLERLVRDLRNMKDHNIIEGEIIDDQ